ncbi:MAG: hypothetical protein VKN33_07140 [Candidatus Sericytochromatia bacterium]|nr:hypothetical protein [Candidatus Sericytochromatia bacterium]
MSRKPAAYLAGSVLLGTAIGAVIGLLTSSRSSTRVEGLVRARLQDTRNALSAPMKKLPAFVHLTSGWRGRLQEGASARLVPLKGRLQHILSVSGKNQDSASSDATCETLAAESNAASEAPEETFKN